jgi:cytochrome c6
MRLRPLTLVLPIALAAVVAATFAVALGAMSDQPKPAAAPPETTQDTPASEPARSDTAASDVPDSARELFAHTCGGCHALRDAGAAGMFGPDLDEVRPSAARVRRMLRTGSLDGVMQPDLLRGEQARRVAAYVARVAGR